MSLIESFLKIVDPAEAQQREQLRKAAREQPKRETPTDPPRFACRVCGHEDIQSAYCPTCLSDTMKPLGAAGRP
jgi:rubrerythrin